MGQINGKDTSSVGSSMVDSAYHDGCGIVMDMKKVSSLTWDEFVDLMQNINEKSRNLREYSGKYLVFAVKKGTTDTFLWKATVSICCIKMNALTDKVESRKYLNLRQFLKVYSSLVDLLEQQSHSGAAGTSENMRASTIISKIDELQSFQKMDDQNECSICMDREKEVVLPCSHGFCLPCIDQWNEHTQLCPTCRADLHSVDDAWIISDFPVKDEISRYLLQLPDKD